MTQKYCYVPGESCRSQEAGGCLDKARNRRKRKEFKSRCPKEVARGAYANAMAVFHNPEEFVIDFLNVFPPTGVATARIITNPGHVKRIIRALQENPHRYEDQFGSVQEALPPTSGPMGYA